MIAALPDHALVLETERLRLRPFSMADTDLAVDLLTDPKVMHYVDDIMTAEEARSMMPLITRRGAGGRIGYWTAELKSTGEKIGDGELTPIPMGERTKTDWSQVVPNAYPTDPVEVGYLLKPAFWGQGFASELCARLLRFAFEQTALDRVVACTDPDNRASQNVLRKSGLRHIGTRRAYAEDVPFFEITRVEWT